MDARCGDNTKSTELKNRKITRESYWNYKVLTIQCSSFKKMHKLKILNLKDLIKLENILFINDCLEEERGRSFNTTFKLMGTNQFHNTQYLVIHTN